MDLLFLANKVCVFVPSCTGAKNYEYELCTTHSVQININVELSRAKVELMKPYSLMFLGF